MKNLINIIEGLKVNSKTKIQNNDSFHVPSQKEIDAIEDKLCYFFQTPDVYKTKQYDNRLLILDEHFNNNIYDFMDYYTGSFDDMADELKMDVNELAHYIENHNEELYKIINDFVL